MTVVELMKTCRHHNHSLIGLVGIKYSGQLESHKQVNHCFRLPWKLLSVVNFASMCQLIFDLMSCV